MAIFLINWTTKTAPNSNNIFGFNSKDKNKNRTKKKTNVKKAFELTYLNRHELIAIVIDSWYSVKVGVTVSIQWFVRYTNFTRLSFNGIFIGASVCKPSNIRYGLSTFLPRNNKNTISLLMIPWTLLGYWSVTKRLLQIKGNCALWKSLLMLSKITWWFNWLLKIWFSYKCAIIFIHFSISTSVVVVPHFQTKFSIISWLILLK